MKIAIGMAVLLLLVGLSVPFIARTLEERRHAAGQEQLEALQAETRKHVAESEAEIERMNRNAELGIYDTRSCDRTTHCGCAASK